MDRSQAIETISQRLGNRRLIWIGNIGEDARSLVGVPQFSHCYATVSPLDAPGVEAPEVETLRGERRGDYDASSLLSPAAQVMIQSLVHAVDAPAAIACELPYDYLPYILSMGRSIDYLGISGDLYRALGDKLAVESELRGRPGIETIAWTVLPEGPARAQAARDGLERGPVVLRGGAHGGGLGHELIQHAGQLAESRLLHIDTPVAMAAYLRDYLPICIGACVFPDGGVTLHTASLQLIGIQACRRHDFGYCGNDFGAIKQLGARTLDRVETCVRSAGAFLHAKGFVGAYGVDLLVREQEVLFVEINPRFLGSSAMSARIDRDADLPDVYLDHLMACLGVPAHESPTLAEQIARQASLSQIYCHNIGPDPVHPAAEPKLPAGFKPSLLPAPDVRVAPGATLCRLTSETNVTVDGLSLLPDAIAAVEAVWRSFES